MTPNNCRMCGVPYAPEQKVQPFGADRSEALVCRACGDQVWANPRAVVVCIQPVVDPETGRTGLAVGRRAIPPMIGTWNLIAGNVTDNGRTLEEEAVREFVEETGVQPGEIVGITKSLTTGEPRGFVLVPVEFEPITTLQWKEARPCHENDALDLWFDERDNPIELGFPLHRKLAFYWAVGEPSFAD